MITNSIPGKCPLRLSASIRFITVVVISGHITLYGTGLPRGCSLMFKCNTGDFV